MRLVAAVLVLLPACVSPAARPCGDGFCPVGLVCIDELAECAVPSEACPDLPDGTRCAAEDRSICVDGACTVSLCGDGFTDPVIDEICDEGPGTNIDSPNAVCRAGCKQRARCGDGITDDAPPDGRAAEGCDQGDANSNLTPGACRAGCLPHFCGDGIVDPDEQPSCLADPFELTLVPDPDRNVRALDLDGDGLLDLIVPRSDASLALRFGRADADFDAVELAAISIYNDWLTGDIDGDGDLDLIGHDSSQLIVRRQLAPRVFDAPAAVDFGIDPQMTTMTAHAVVDLDGDGMVDLVAFSFDESRVRLALGGGAFAPVVITTHALRVSEVEPGHIDDDAAADLYIGGKLGIGWLRGDGAGGLALADTLIADTMFLLGFEAADFNRDGRLNLAVVPSFGPALRVFLATGGGFSDTSVGLAASAFQIQVGDLEPDGDADVLITLSGETDGLQIARNGGFGAFVAEPPFVLAGVSPNAVPGPIVDLDHDGFSDVLFSDTGLQLLLARGGDGAVGPPQVVLDGQVFSFALPDLDGDGDRDVVALDNQLVSGLENRGGLRFAPLVVEQGANGGGRAADLDGDGRDEVLARTNDAIVVLGLVAPDTLAVLSSTVLADASASVDIQVGDVDGDGHDDLVTMTYPLAGGASIEVRRGAPGPSLAPAVPFSGALPVFGFSALADMNGDGRTNLIVQLGSTWFVHHGRASGDFDPAGVEVLDALGPLVAGDLDHDGDGDAVVRTIDGLAVYLGQPDGHLARAALLSHDVNDAATTIGDVNGDGDADVLVQDDSEGALMLWLGDGNGALVGPISMGPLTMAQIADLGGDGLGDVIGLHCCEAPGTALVVRAGRATLAP